MRDEMLTELKVTPEQRAQIEEIAARFDAQGQRGPDGWGERLRAMEEVLTPEQSAQARELMAQRFRSRIQERIAVLPPGEQEKFMEKLEERRRGWEREGRSPGGRGAEAPREGAPQ